MEMSDGENTDASSIVSTFFLCFTELLMVLIEASILPSIPFRGYDSFEDVKPNRNIYKSSGHTTTHRTGTWSLVIRCFKKRTGLEHCYTNAA